MYQGERGAGIPSHSPCSILGPVNPRAAEISLSSPNLSGSMAGTDSAYPGPGHISFVPRPGQPFFPREEARDKIEDFKSSISKMKVQLLAEQSETWPGQGTSRRGGWARLCWAAILLFCHRKCSYICYREFKWLQLISFYLYSFSIIIVQSPGVNISRSSFQDLRMCFPETVDLKYTCKEFPQVKVDVDMTLNTFGNQR